MNACAEPACVCERRAVDARRCARRRVRCRLRHLLEEFRGTLLHLRGCEILLARGDPPCVARRIGDRAAAVAPELIRERHLHLRAGADGAVEERIAVLDIEPQRRRRSAERLRAFLAHHDVVQHDARVADPDLGMHDLAVRTDTAAQFFGAERLRVPVNRLRRVVQRELRRDRVIPIGYRLRCVRHLEPPFR